MSAFSVDDINALKAPLNIERAKPLEVAAELAVAHAKASHCEWAPSCDHLDIQHSTAWQANCCRVPIPLSVANTVHLQPFIFYAGAVFIELMDSAKYVQMLNFS